MGGKVKVVVVCGEEVCNRVSIGDVVECNGVVGKVVNVVKSKGRIYVEEVA